MFTHLVIACGCRSMTSGNGGPGGEGEALKAIFTNVRNAHSSHRAAATLQHA
jgi:hypothetical protein